MCAIVFISGLVNNLPSDKCRIYRERAEIKRTANSVSIIVRTHRSQCVVAVFRYLRKSDRAGPLTIVVRQNIHVAACEFRHDIINNLYNLFTSSLIFRAICCSPSDFSFTQREGASNIIFTVINCYRNQIRTSRRQFISAVFFDCRKSDVARPLARVIWSKLSYCIFTSNHRSRLVNHRDNLLAAVRISGRVNSYPCNRS